jgi:hypothetical protein
MGIPAMRRAPRSKWPQCEPNKALRFALFVLLLAPSAASERPTGVRGQVVYEIDGRPLRDVYVLAHLIEGKGERESIAHTDFTG